jgi:hypothetical protein
MILAQAGHQINERYFNKVNLKLLGVLCKRLTHREILCVKANPYFLKPLKHCIAVTYPSYWAGALRYTTPHLSGSNLLLLIFINFKLLARTKCKNQSISQDAFIYRLLINY